MDWLQTTLFIVVLNIGLSQCRVGDDDRKFEECVLGRLSLEEGNRLLRDVEDHHKDPNTLLRSLAIAAGRGTPLRDAYVACSSSHSGHKSDEKIPSFEKVRTSGDPDSNKTVLSRRRETRHKRSPQSFWQPSETLQTVLSNILLNSDPFAALFSGNTARHEALSLARAAVLAGLSGFHASVVQDAANAVANALSRLPFDADTGSYAAAIAGGVASTLDSRRLAFSADGAGIGNAMVARLQGLIDESAFASASSAWATSGQQNFQTNSRNLPTLQMNPPNFQTNTRDVPTFQMNPPNFQSNTRNQPPVGLNPPNLQTNSRNLPTLQRNPLNFQTNSRNLPTLQTNPFGSVPAPQINRGFLRNSQSNTRFLLNSEINPGSLPTLQTNSRPLPNLQPSTQFLNPDPNPTSSASHQTNLGSFPILQSDFAVLPTFNTNPGSLPMFERNPASGPSFDMNPGSSPTFSLNPGAGPAIDLNPGSGPTSDMNPGPTFDTNPGTFADPDEFRSDLAFFLYQSEQLRSTFCDNPLPPGVFTTVSEALSAFGPSASATAVNAMASADDPCASYGDVMAEAVTTALGDPSADALEISEAIAARFAPPEQDHFPESPSEEVKPEYPLLDPSFSSTDYNKPPQDPDYGLPPFVPIEEPPKSPPMPPQEEKSSVEYPIVDPSFTPADNKQPPQDPDYALPPFVPVEEPPRSPPMPAQERKLSPEYPSGPSFSPTDYELPPQNPDYGVPSLVPIDVPPQSPQQEVKPSTLVDTQNPDYGTPSAVPEDELPKNPPYPLQDPNNRTPPVPPMNEPSQSLPMQPEEAITPSSTVSSTDVAITVFIPSPTPSNDDQRSTPDEGSSAPSSSKRMDAVLEDIFSALRSLNDTASTTSQPEMAAPSVAPLSTYDGAATTTPVDLQPSFLTTPTPSVGDEDDSDLIDPTLSFAHHVSDVASTAISLLQGGATVDALCYALAPLGPLVDIPPLDVCDQGALLHFLLAVLKATTLILRGV